MKGIIYCVLFTSIFFYGCGGRKEDKSFETYNNKKSETAAEESIKKPLVQSDGEALKPETMSEEEKKEFLKGRWEIYYPSPDRNWGHEFIKDNSYSYWDHSEEAKAERYWLTEGIWKIVKNDIQVQIKSYMISDRDPEMDPVLGFGFPHETKYITIEVNDNTWHTIGTLESVVTGIVKGEYEYPPQIELKVIRFDKVLDEVNKYYQLDTM